MSNKSESASIPNSASNYTSESDEEITLAEFKKKVALKAKGKRPAVAHDPSDSDGKAQLPVSKPSSSPRPSKKIKVSTVSDGPSDDYLKCFPFTDTIPERLERQKRSMDHLFERTESLDRTASLQGMVLKDVLTTSMINRRRCDELEEALKHALALINNCSCKPKTYHLS